MRGGGTGKWVKLGWWPEPELGVMEMVEGRCGGALPPRGERCSSPARPSPADLEPNSAFTSTCCLQILEHFNQQLNFSVLSGCETLEIKNLKLTNVD